MLLRNRHGSAKPQAGVRRGAAALELAIWLPFLSLMFVVALEYCQVYYVTQTVQAAASAGAMYASGVSAPTSGTSSSAAAIQAAVAEGASLNPPLASANVTVTQSGSQTQVNVSYQYTVILTFPGSASTITISKSVWMNVIPLAGS